MFDEQNSVLYVSNTNGKDPWARNGEGSIGKVGTHGQIIAAEWVKGLNAPKGMGLYRKQLFVADIDQLVVIDIVTGTIMRSIPVDGAEGLNDVTIDKDGMVYVSDSKIKKIYRIDNNTPTVWLENLHEPNGVLYFDDVLYLLDNGASTKPKR